MCNNRRTWVFEMTAVVLSVHCLCIQSVCDCNPVCLWATVASHQGNKLLLLAFISLPIQSNQFAHVITLRHRCRLWRKQIIKKVGVGSSICGFKENVLSFSLFKLNCLHLSLMTYRQTNNRLTLGSAFCVIYRIEHLFHRQNSSQTYFVSVGDNNDTTLMILCCIMRTNDCYLKH